MTGNKRSDTCFMKIGQSVVLPTFFERNLDSLQFADYFGFESALLPMSLLMREPVLASVHAIAPIARGGVLRLQPHSCYVWHQDESRGVCINLLLTPDSPSHTLFGFEQKGNRSQIDIIALNYQPSTFYLFNNQIPHTVINFDQPRFLFSLEFEAGKHQLTYAQLVNAIRPAMPIVDF